MLTIDTILKLIFDKHYFSHIIEAIIYVDANIEKINNSQVIRNLTFYDQLQICYPYSLFQTKLETFVIVQ